MSEASEPGRALVPLKVNGDLVETTKKRGRKAAAEAPQLERHDLLRSYVERLVNLFTQKAEVSADIKDVSNQAKNAGFSKKALTVLVARQLETEEERRRRELIEDEVDRMAVALKLDWAKTPLGQAASNTVQ